MTILWERPVKGEIGHSLTRCLQPVPQPIINRQEQTIPINKPIQTTHHINTTNTQSQQHTTQTIFVIIQPNYTYKICMDKQLDTYRQK